MLMSILSLLLRNADCAKLLLYFAHEHLNTVYCHEKPTYDN